MAFHGIGQLKRSAISYFEHKASIEVDVVIQGICIHFNIFLLVS
jgi:hypothetical protein